MKTTGELLSASTNTHQNWATLLDVAVREVFELMLGSKLTAPAEPFEERLDITAMVGLAGQLCGLMSVRCSQQACILMASKMLGVEPDNVGSEMGDAFGEICNMVAGNFKNKIAGLSDGCMLSVPTVITGEDYNLHSLADTDAIEVRLLFENKPLVVALQIHS